MSASRACSTTARRARSVAGGRRRRARARRARARRPRGRSRAPPARARRRRRAGGREQPAVLEVDARRVGSERAGSCVSPPYRAAARPASKRSQVQSSPSVVRVVDALLLARVGAVGQRGVEHARPALDRAHEAAAAHEHEPVRRARGLVAARPAPWRAGDVGQGDPVAVDERRCRQHRCILATAHDHPRPAAQTARTWRHAGTPHPAGRPGDGDDGRVDPRRGRPGPAHGPARQRRASCSSWWPCTRSRSRPS